MSKEIAKIEKPVGVVQIKDTPIDDALVALLVSNSEVKENELKTIIRNKARVVRNLPKDKSTDLWICSEIIKIAHAYGSADEVSLLVQNECLKALRNEFKSLSMAEVWAAFRAHSAGTLTDEKGRGEMYSGKLTAKAFISVLGMWRKYKMKVECEYFNTLAQRELDKENEERAKKMKEVFWPTLKSSLLSLREKDSTWRDCPVYIFDALRKNNLILGLESKEVWQPIWTRATEMARFDILASEQTATVRGGVKLIGDVAKAQVEAKVATASVTIAKKIALFDLVVKNFHFDINFVTDGLTL